MVRVWLTALIVLLLGQPAAAQSYCSILYGASIVANDGQFLGRIINQFTRDSLFNEFGPHGGQFSRTSIWNEFGPYGGEFSRNSPFNQFTRTPPMIIRNGQVVAYLTVVDHPRAVNPYWLKACENEL